TTVTDQQGVYEFPDLVDGTWKVQITMRGFSTLDGEALVAPDKPQGAWELKMLGLEQMLAESRVTRPESTLQTRTAGGAEAPKPEEAPAPEAPRPTDETADR